MNTSAVKKRIVWTDKHLFKIGLSMDQLKADASLKLLPDAELLMTYAQKEALPMELRRKLTKAQALSVLERIDALRTAAEVNEAFGQEAEEDALLQQGVFVTDSDESKRMARILLELRNMEDRLAARQEVLLNQQADRLFLRLAALMDKKGIASLPEEVKTAKNATFAVFHDVNASWAPKVKNTVASLNREGFNLVAYPVDPHSGKGYVEDLPSTTAGVFVLTSTSDPHVAANNLFTSVEVKLFDWLCLSPTDVAIRKVACASQAQNVLKLKAEMQALLKMPIVKSA